MARMPTQGSWRPVVTTSTGSPWMSRLSTGNRRLEVGLNATEQRSGWPELMPPRTPPAWLDSKPVVVMWRSEEHTSELQSLMRRSYAVFCLKKTSTHRSELYQVSVFSNSYVITY